MKNHKPKIRRRADQVSVGFFAKREFVERLRRHVDKLGTNRSDFIRRAIAEQMKRDGDVVPKELLAVLPPYTAEAGVSKRDETVI
jgi:hypothetical protein